MQYTQAQIDRANAVSLEDFLRTQGETLIKSGREYRWKEHDSLTVRGNKWFRHSQSKGGYHGRSGTLADRKKTDEKKNPYSGCLLCEQRQDNQCHEERFALCLGFFYNR